MNNQKKNNEIDIDTEKFDDQGEINPKSYISQAVIRRLPRYFRYLRELIRQDRRRISSSELSEIMDVTASQIRQDLNCFGGFGQQGYGYNVNYLYTKICDILGVGAGFHAIIIGIGNLGRALVRAPMFEKRGVDIIGLFDVDKNLIGSEVAGKTVYDMSELEKYIDENVVDIAVLTLPKEFADEVTERLDKAGVPGIWNLTGKELKAEHCVIEEVHIGDSLMTLCYELNKINNDNANGKNNE